MGVSAVLRSAHAQSGDASDPAEQVFQEGVALAAAKRCAEAALKFEASARYDSEKIRTAKFDLALCYDAIDKLASASKLYREAFDLAKASNDLQVLQGSLYHEAIIAPKLATLTLFPPDNPPAGFVVTRDGVPIEPIELGSTQPVDAGTYQIIASAPGFEPYGRTVTVVDGHVATLAIPSLTAKPVPAVVTDAPKPAPRRHTRPPEPTAPPSRTRTYVAIGAGAAGVAAFGIGLMFGDKARSTYKQAEQRCGIDLVCSNRDDYDSSLRWVQQAQSSATISTVLVVAGGAAIATGAFVLLTAPRSPERTTAHIVPVVHDHGAGLAITRGF